MLVARRLWHHFWIRTLVARSPSIRPSLCSKNMATRCYQFRQWPVVTLKHFTGRRSPCVGPNSVEKGPWFEKFRSVDLSLEDAPRSGQPTTAHDNSLKAFVEADPLQTVREIAENLAVSRTAVKSGLKCIGKVKSSESGSPRFECRVRSVLLCF